MEFIVEKEDIRNLYFEASEPKDTIINNLTEADLGYLTELINRIDYTYEEEVWDELLLCFEENYLNI